MFISFQLVTTSTPTLREDPVEPPIGPNVSDLADGLESVSGATVTRR